MSYPLFEGYELRGRVPVPAQRKARPGADLTGKKFTRLTVEKMLGMSDVANRAWGCRCECGVRLVVNARCLTKSQVRSCGCLNSEVRGQRGAPNKLPYGHASRNELFASYKKSATSRGHEFELSLDAFVALVSANCTYCGSPPDLVRRPNKGVNGEFVYTGIDRVQNDIGYVAGNVVSCCWVCNRAKGPMTVAEFARWLDRAASFRANGGAK